MKKEIHNTHISHVQYVNLKSTKDGPVLKLYFDTKQAAYGAAEYLWREGRLQIGMTDSEKNKGWNNCVDDRRACIEVKSLHAITGVHELLVRDHPEVTELFSGTDCSYPALKGMESRNVPVKAPPVRLSSRTLQQVTFAQNFGVDPRRAFEPQGPKPKRVR